MVPALRPRGMGHQFMSREICLGICKKERNPISKPLFLGVLSGEGICLKNEQSDKYARYRPCSMPNPVTCSHGYPQKMGKESGNKSSCLGSRMSAVQIMSPNYQ